MANDKNLKKKALAKKASPSILAAKLDEVRRLGFKSLSEEITEGKTSVATALAFKKAFQDAADSLKL